MKVQWYSGIGSSEENEQVNLARTPQPEASLIIIISTKVSFLGFYTSHLASLALIGSEIQRFTFGCRALDARHNPSISLLIRLMKPGQSGHRIQSGKMFRGS